MVSAKLFSLAALVGMACAGCLAPPGSPFRGPVRPGLSLNRPPPLVGGWGNDEFDRLMRKILLETGEDDEALLGPAMDKVSRNIDTYCTSCTHWAILKTKLDLLRNFPEVVTQMDHDRAAYEELLSDFVAHGEARLPHDPEFRKTFALVGDVTRRNMLEAHEAFDAAKGSDGGLSEWADEKRVAAYENGLDREKRGPLTAILIGILVPIVTGLIGKIFNPQPDNSYDYDQDYA